jgi:hypothetical protein
MLSSNRTKLFHALLILAISFSAACAAQWSRADENSNADSDQSFAARELQTGIPFPNKEPEVFQTEIVAADFADGEKFERRTFLARSGLKRLTVFGVGEKSEISLLQADETKTLTLFPPQKIYKETPTSQTAATAAGGETLQGFLTSRWLNAKTDAAFENLGADDSGLNRFRARLDDSDSTEILIYVDENLKIPVRQEFYRRGAGDQKTLLSQVELRNFKTQADDKLFQLPPGFRQVPAAEFDKIVRQTKE